MCETFYQSVSEEDRLAWQELLGLEETLQSQWREARAAWPKLHVEACDFARYLAERIPAPSLEALHAMHRSDLYLACACATGNEAAIEHFDRYCAGECERGIAKLSLASNTIEEVKQGLRDRLFVATVPGNERIRRYSGKGPIHAWYRVAALRLAIDQLRASDRLVPVADLGDLDAHVPMLDPELEFLKETYRQHFKDCFHAALRDLSSEQRNLLRYQLLEGLTLEQIGLLYGVHLSSIARRLQKTRQVLLDCTRGNLQRRLGVDDGELDSIMRLIRSRLDVSISKVLQREPLPLTRSHRDPANS